MFTEQSLVRWKLKKNPLTGGDGSPVGRWKNHTIRNNQLTPGPPRLPPDTRIAPGFGHRTNLPAQSGLHGVPPESSTPCLTTQPSYYQRHPTSSSFLSQGRCRLRHDCYQLYPLRAIRAASQAVVRDVACRQLHYSSSQVSVGLTRQVHTIKNSSTACRHCWSCGFSAVVPCIQVCQN